jgi:Methyltransferase domain
VVERAEELTGMRLYLPPSLTFAPKRMAFSTWVDHLPFGYDLVAALRPETLVELGTQTGVSYFCFCQSALEQGTNTRCFAVDTWRGDAHTSAYDEKIWEEVRSHNEAHYPAFSTLYRMLFEEAVERFADESIELLHIDGYHTYEAVRGDFERWYPKVRPGGIVLFHDIAARLMDFGAWRYFEELRASHETFWFKHGFGLGVLRKPGPAVDAPLLRFLFSKDEAEQQRLRAFYVHAAEHAELSRKSRRLARLQP